MPTEGVQKLHAAIVEDIWAMFFTAKGLPRKTPGIVSIQFPLFFNLRKNDDYPEILFKLKY